MTKTVFAIGDIHGRFDLLMKALQSIEERSHSGCKVVFLGDYIDRGPQSKEVIEALMRGPPRECDEWVVLKGNHEDMMAQVHREQAPWDWWIRNGGEATVASYGGRVPDQVLRWADELPISHQDGEYFFVHAGVHPGVALADQKPEEMLWIRDVFLDSWEDFGAHVVHGHTPVNSAQTFSNRTNLDSGAYYSGRLSVGVFDTSIIGGPRSVYAVAA